MRTNAFRVAVLALSALLPAVAQGQTDAQIAEQLLLSPHTVHRHVANVRTKLGVATRSAAAAWAVTNHEG